MIRRFAACDRGSVAILFAFAIIPVLLAVGVGVDLGRAYFLRAKLGHALDAAGLAAGSSLGTPEELKALGRRYFDANFQSALGEMTDFDLHVAGDVITVSGTAELNTSFMLLGGVDTMEVAAAAEVTRAVKGLEMTMVLDNTGSMYSNDNIGALRVAAGDLVDILFGDKTSHPFLRVGLVPYSAAVNPGADRAAELGVVPPATGGKGKGKGKAKEEDEPWKGCVMERPVADPHADTPASATPWTAYRWESDVDNNWKSNGIHKDMDASTGPNLGCPTAITPLTADKATVDDAIDAMEAWFRGGTLGDVGMAWGRRVLSPEEPFAEGAPWDDDTWHKALVLMTDGENQMFKLTDNKKGAPNNSVHPTAKSDFTAYGRLGDNPAMINAANRAEATAVIDQRLADLCAEMKAQGVEIYAITFTSGIPQSTRDIFAACASEPANYFHAPSQADLKSAFRTVGTRLANLRLSH